MNTISRLFLTLCVFSTMALSMIATTESEVQIRLATKEDISELNDLIALSGRKLSVGYYTEPQIESAIRNLFGVDEALIEDQTYYVLLVNNKIAGCGGFSARQKLFGKSKCPGPNDTLYLDPLMDAAKIRALFIHPDFARQGFGQILLDHCEEMASLHGFSRFELMATLPGIPLYRKNGYEKQRDENYELPEGISLPLVFMTRALLDEPDFYDPCIHHD